MDLGTQAVIGLDSEPTIDSVRADLKRVFLAYYCAQLQEPQGIKQVLGEALTQLLPDTTSNHHVKVRENVATVTFDTTQEIPSSELENLRTLLQWELPPAIDVKLVVKEKNGNLNKFIFVEHDSYEEKPLVITY